MITYFGSLSGQSPFGAGTVCPQHPALGLAHGVGKCMMLCPILILKEVPLGDSHTYCHIPASLRITQEKGLPGILHSLVRQPVGNASFFSIFTLEKILFALY